ncbi:hypothetical protein Tco_0037714 [Tanacetum coccineum]
MGVNVEDGMVKNAASKLGCLVLKTPFTYFGYECGGKYVKEASLERSGGKVLSRLSRGKMKLLSIWTAESLFLSPFGSLMARIRKVTKLLGFHPIEAGEGENHAVLRSTLIMRKISLVEYRTIWMVNSYEERQVWLVSIRIQSKPKGVLEGVYYGLWWYMWNFRNKLLFDKKIP